MPAQLEKLRSEWPTHRARFCQGMDPEAFLAEIHGYRWTPAMIRQLEQETRTRHRAEPGVPIIEHMLDAAIAVRSEYPRPLTP